jgi:hypothetical protein
VPTRGPLGQTTFKFGPTPQFPSIYSIENFTCSIMPYNLRNNANGRRESRSNDDETTSTSIETVESVNPTLSASVETGEGIPKFLPDPSYSTRRCKSLH